jgi:hypothetical protein
VSLQNIAGELRNMLHGTQIFKVLWHNEMLLKSAAMSFVDSA